MLLGLPQRSGSGLGALQALTGLAQAGGVSCPLSAAPSDPSCSDPDSGCSRAFRVSACHSFTRSVGVFPAWGDQEESWSLFGSLFQEAPSSVPVVPHRELWQCLETFCSSHLVVLVVVGGGEWVLRAS